MELMSIPSCTISQRGLISRSLLTVPTILSTTKSISLSVVKRPIPNLNELCAISSAAPKARKTYDGSKEAEVQADPEERAISCVWQTGQLTAELGQRHYFCAISAGTNLLHMYPWRHMFTRLFQLTLRAIKRLSPSTYAKLRFTQPGYPLESPFLTTNSI